MAMTAMRQNRRWRWVTPALFVFALGEHMVPIPWRPTPVIADAYSALAREPAGAVVELPIYSRPASFNRTQYMIASTVHWKPLVNAYSDFTPASFASRRDTLAEFPTREAFEALQSLQARYIVFHLDAYSSETGARQSLVVRLDEFGPHLRPIYADDSAWVYEIVSYPGELLAAGRDTTDPP
jgi:hypothetical protein